MDRKSAKAKLERLLARVDEGGLPVEVNEVHVFGSYARGASRPNDIDLVIVHQKYDRARWRGADDFWAALKETRKAIRRPGDRFQLFMSYSIEDAVAQLAEANPVLLWSRDDRNWRAKLEAIAEHREAGRFPRRASVFDEHPGWDRLWRSDLDEVQDALDSGRLRLTKIPLDAVSPESLSRTAQGHLARLLQIGRWGPRVKPLIPAAIAWLNSVARCDIKSLWSDSHRFRSVDGSAVVYVGRPPVLWALTPLESKGVRLYCGIPYLRVTKANYLWVFSRPEAHSTQRSTIGTGGINAPG